MGWQHGIDLLKISYHFYRIGITAAAVVVVYGHRTILWAKPFPSL